MPITIKEFNEIYPYFRAVRVEDKPTDNMQEFIDANKESPVCYGETDHGELFYKLENGDCFWLTKQDIKSAPNFMPDWGF